MMDVQTYKRNLNTGIPFGDDYAAKLRRLMSNPSYEAWQPLLQAMLSRRKRVEQDSILPVME